ncbi:MAG: histidine kinase dimerization/phosphoacceptor domain -containing protein [Pseudomonadota bacterium]
MSKYETPQTVTPIGIAKDRVPRPSLLADRSQADRASALGPAFLLSIIENTPACIKVMDLDGSLLFINHRGVCENELESAESVIGSVWWSRWPTELRNGVRDAFLKARDGAETQFRGYCQTARGKLKWWDVSLVPLRALNGEVIRILGTSRDVTREVVETAELRESEAQLQQLTLLQAEGLTAKDSIIATTELATREVDHRVKNSLQMVQSMLNLRSRDADHPEVKTELAGAANNVATVARVHEQLYRTGAEETVELSSYLRALSEDLTTSAQQMSAQVTISPGPVGRVSSDLATAIGVAIAELASNALKHAFSDRTDASDCTLSIDHSIAPISGHHRIVFADNGKGMPADFDLSKSSRLGMRVIVELLKAKDYGIALQRSERGARFLITSTTDLAKATSATRIVGDAERAAVREGLTNGLRLRQRSRSPVQRCNQALRE